MGTQLYAVAGTLAHIGHDCVCRPMPVVGALLYFNVEGRGRGRGCSNVGTVLMLVVPRLVNVATVSRIEWSTRWCVSLCVIATHTSMDHWEQPTCITWERQLGAVSTN